MIARARSLAPNGAACALLAQGAAAPRRCARLRRLASSPGGARAGAPVPLAFGSGAPRSGCPACPSVPPDLSGYARQSPGSGSPLGRRSFPAPFCALRVRLSPAALSLACCVRSGAARPPPLRGPGPASPSLRSPGPPLGPSGRGSGARACVRRCAAPWPLAAPGPLPLALAALRVSLAVALAALGRGSAAAVGRRFLSGPPAARLWGRLAPAPGRARPSGPLSAGLRPGAFLCSRPPASAALVRSGAAAAVAAGFSPAPPPRPCRPRWGLAGSVRPPAGGCGPRSFAAPRGLDFRCSPSHALSHCSGPGKDQAGRKRPCLGRCAFCGARA